MENNATFSALYKLLTPIGLEQSDLVIVDRTIFTEILRALPGTDIERLAIVAKSARFQTLMDRISSKALTLRKQLGITQSQLAETLLPFGIRLKQEDISFLERKSEWGKFGFERLIDIDRALSLLGNSSKSDSTTITE